MGKAHNIFSVSGLLGACLVAAICITSSSEVFAQKNQIKPGDQHPYGDDMLYPPGTSIKTNQGTMVTVDHLDQEEIADNKTPTVANKTFKLNDELSKAAGAKGLKFSFSKNGELTGITDPISGASYGIIRKKADKKANAHRSEY